MSTKTILLLVGISIISIAAYATHDPRHTSGTREITNCIQVNYDLHSYHSGYPNRRHPYHYGYLSPRQREWINREEARIHALERRFWYDGFYSPRECEIIRMEKMRLKDFIRRAYYNQYHRR